MHRRERGIEGKRTRQREGKGEREEERERGKKPAPSGPWQSFSSILHPARIPGSHTRVTDMKLMGPYGMQLLLHRA